METEYYLAPHWVSTSFLNSCSRVSWQISSASSKKACSRMFYTLSGLTLMSAESILVSKSISLGFTGPDFATYFFTDGCILQKHSLFLRKMLKFLSPGSVLENGGAPKVMINKMTPSEKISAGIPMYVSPWDRCSISGAM